jgi:capsular polysaccharide biosynthesis protein
VEFSRSISILWRRWYIFAPALLLALVITAGVFLSVKPTYSAETTITLVPPPASALATKGVTPSNYNSYDNSNTVAAIIATAETSQLAAQKFQKQGVPNTAYTIVEDPTGNTPSLLVTATSTTPGLAMSWDKTLGNDVVTYIQKSQAKSSLSTWFTTTSIPPVKALKSDKSRLRVGVAVGVVTVLLALSLTLIFDSIMVQRSSRRRRATALPVVASQSGAEDFYTGGSIATMHGADSRGRTSALRRP